MTIDKTPNGVLAQVVHYKNGSILQASTAEWPIRKYLYKTNDTSAYINLARVSISWPAISTILLILSILFPKHAHLIKCPILLDCLGIRSTLHRGWHLPNGMRRRRHTKWQSRQVPENGRGQRCCPKRIGEIPETSSKSLSSNGKTVGSDCGLELEKHQQLVLHQFYCSIVEVVYMIF